MSKKLFFPMLAVSIALAGCGETTIVTPTERTVEKKVKVSDDKVETKEKIVRDNPDGTTTKTETKTETK